MQVAQAEKREDVKTCTPTNVREHAECLAPSKKEDKEHTFPSRPVGLEALTELAQNSSIAISEKAQQFNSAVSDITKVAGQNVRKAADATLDSLATYPEKNDGPIEPGSVLAKAIAVLPILGPTKNFADARAKFEKAKETSDEKLLYEARKDCIFACIELGIDLSFMPVATAVEGANLLVRGVAFFKNTAEFALVKQVRHFNKSLGLKLDHRFARLALKSPIAVRAIDGLLGIASDQT